MYSVSKDDITGAGVGGFALLILESKSFDFDFSVEYIDAS